MPIGVWPAVPTTVTVAPSTGGLPDRKLSCSMMSCPSRMNCAASWRQSTWLTAGVVVTADCMVFFLSAAHAVRLGHGHELVGFEHGQLLRSSHAQGTPDVLRIDRIAEAVKALLQHRLF